jgi:thiamine biosynthesis lipoprotein
MLKRCRPLLGTFVEITAGHEEAIDTAFDAIAKVHQLMSAHEPGSDLSQINRFGHRRNIEVHEWTARVLERALYWAKQSGGAFDPIRAGNASGGRGSIPRHPDQPEPEAAHWTWLELQGRSVRLMKPGCIDLGGIAKGFAVDRAIDALRRAGCSNGLVNAGGDLAAFGPDSWPVEIVDPLSRHPLVEVRVDNAALATSAGVRRGGQLSFDHLGGASPRWTSVTVLASNACDADALTKLAWFEADRLRTIFADTDAKAIGITREGIVESIWEPEGRAA